MPLDSPARTTDLDLVLPGDWWQIPLTSQQESAASIREYVAQAVGKRDDRAQARHDLREHLGTAADDARTAGGVALYILRELDPGVSIPITLTTYQPSLPHRLSDEVGIAVAAESLASSLRDTGPEAMIEVFADDDLAVVRDLRIRLITAEDGRQEYLVRADYWLLRGVVKEPWLLAFGAPVIWGDELEALGDFMDAVVRTVTWVPTAS